MRTKMNEAASGKARQQSLDGQSPRDIELKEVLSSTSKDAIRKKISEFKSEAKIDLLLDQVDRILVQFAHAAAGNGNLRKHLSKAVTANESMAEFVGEMPPEMAARFFAFFDSTDLKHGMNRYFGEFERVAQSLTESFKATRVNGPNPRDSLKRRLLRSLIHMWGEKISPGGEGNLNNLRAAKGGAGRIFIHSVLSRAHTDGIQIRKKHREHGNALMELTKIGRSTIKKRIASFNKPGTSRSMFDGNIPDGPISSADLSDLQLRMMNANKPLTLLAKKKKERKPRKKPKAPKRLETRKKPKK